ncbi:MAG: glycosyltransferase family 4 protein [Bdellovibrionales bacterium]|nr:glycosyltransferase family 4 protein [Bdellovibrionales bacterium]
MRVAQVYNQQRSIGGGEERVVLQTTEWLKERGIETDLLIRSSRELEASIGKKLTAAFTGIYNPEAYRYMRKYIERVRPHVVHAHNLFPQWSPSVLAACRDAGVPSLFTVHCQILTCPTWYHLHNGMVCEKCLHSGEHWCIIQNCRDNYAESIVYALRGFLVRKFRLFHDAVALLITPTDFMRQKLIDAGFPAERIRTVWNAVEIPAEPAQPASGEYVAFAGRLSAEKGVRILLDAARRMPSILFRIAGTGGEEEFLRSQAGSNVEFVGFLSQDELRRFYRGARLLALPSVSYETFSLAAAEGLAMGLPVVATAIGGVPELVLDGERGMLVEPGNAAMLADAIQQLWEDRWRCAELGANGRTWASEHLTKERYVDALLNLYDEAGSQRSDRTAEGTPV